MNKDQVKGTAEKVKGKVNEAVGRATGDKVQQARCEAAMSCASSPPTTVRPGSSPSSEATVSLSSALTAQANLRSSSC